MIICSLDRKFRFVDIWSRDPVYGDRCRFTFLFHKPTVLFRGQFEHNYNILNDGRLMIWIQVKDHSLSKPYDIKSWIYEADHHMVIELNKALLEEAEANMLGLNDNV